MTPLEQMTLVNTLVAAPWFVALGVGIAVVALRPRHRWATGLAVAGLAVVLVGSIAAKASLAAWLRLWLPGEAFDAAAAVARTAYRFHRPVGFTLVLAAAFVGRSGASQDPKPPTRGP